MVHTKEDEKHSSCTSNVQLSVGAVVISACMSFLSFGVVLAFGWHYFLQFGTVDKLLYKTVVTTCLLLCLGDTVASGLWAYRWTTTYYGDYSSLLATPKESIALLFLFPTTTIIVQLWFACRIWAITMRRNTWLPALIVTLAFASWSIALWMFSVLIRRHSSVIDDSNVLFPIGYVWLAGGIVADAFIFGGLSYYSKIRTRSKRTQHLLSPRSLWSICCRMIECNVLPLFAQIVLIILFKTNVGFYYVLSDMTIAKGVKSQEQPNSHIATFNPQRTATVQVRQDVHVTHDSGELSGPGSLPWQTTLSGKELDNDLGEYNDGKATLGDV
ncbi:hypothetical protein BT96DRAFT_171246 [Gymnopus androsaceus JB14]|uniref:Family A G protein-coupled receptor-like protein n=1 Tax=Gymnopus androsaceus JB14 TaxID=1447944 RepID=A0A6A4I4X1_9AGAR|nr:hypothetical protein BT96DRAFT_171246 [Gymnopus androsaceus JB14]